MTIEQRLERLERENRWVRRIGVVAAAVHGAESRPASRAAAARITGL